MFYISNNHYKKPLKLPFLAFFYQKRNSLPPNDPILIFRLVSKTFLDIADISFYKVLLFQLFINKSF